MFFIYAGSDGYACMYAKKLLCSHFVYRTCTEPSQENKKRPKKLRKAIGTVEEAIHDFLYVLVFDASSHYFLATWGRGLEENGVRRCPWDGRRLFNPRAIIPQTYETGAKQYLRAVKLRQRTHWQTTDVDWQVSHCSERLSQLLLVNIGVGHGKLCHPTQPKDESYTRPTMISIDKGPQSLIAVRHLPMKGWVGSGGVGAVRVTIIIRFGWVGSGPSSKMYNNCPETRVCVLTGLCPLFRRKVH